MSNKNSPPSVGGTLAGGIQDVAAILPLIGTEQCEKHVGSALSGGYLYAAGAPLSIFGSLGIVKAGITILVSVIAISIPHISFSFGNVRTSIKYLGERKWLGGRMLKDAGFELTGGVASLIGMDGRRFRAETRLIEMLEEKHIDNPDKLSVDWKSRQWNIMLVISTIFGGVLSLMPYLALIHGPSSWRPISIHLPWLFPILRILGSCAAAVTCQFILQFRVISLMKTRILFMSIHRRLDAISQEGSNAWLHHPNLTWDANLPAEECISSLEQYVARVSAPRAMVKDGQEPQHQTGFTRQSAPTPEDKSDSLNHVSIPVEDFPFDIHDLRQLQREHFPTPTRDSAFMMLSWFVLALSLPATVAGYVGCFTLVSATSARGNGPLVWAGLEAALSVLRIIIWASNPAFDEKTEVSLGLKLSEHQPMVTTNDYNPYIAELTHKQRKPFTLVPEREFLEHITPFTGPLDQFPKSSDHISLYFTLTHLVNPISPLHQTFISGRQSKPTCLIMTVFDSDMQIGVSVVFSHDSFYYFDVGIKYDTISRKLEANIQSTKSYTHPWRIEDSALFNSVEKYYRYIVEAFNVHSAQATLSWNWDLVQKPGPPTQGNNMRSHPILPSLTAQDWLYIDRGHEHQLKSDLVATWGGWILEGMGNIRTQARLDCHEALRDVTSEKAKWELCEFDQQMVWEWAWREMVLPEISMELEDILREKLDLCVLEVDRVREDKQLAVWMHSEFESGRRKRMEQERRAVRKRMEEAMKEASAQAETDLRSWKGDEFQWTRVIEMIDNQWSAGINARLEDFKTIEEQLTKMTVADVGRFWFGSPDRGPFLKRFKKQISHELLRPQRKLEHQMMKASVDHIQNTWSDSAWNVLGLAYRYPQPDIQATAKFAVIAESTSKGEACAAIVYDAWKSSKEAVCNAIAKTTTRSVIKVDPEFVDLIPPNDHLLFLSCLRKGQEPAFVQRNRDRWWDEQTTSSYTFYFTPVSCKRNWCTSSGNRGIAQILLFLATSSTIQASVLHHARDVDSVSLCENGEELTLISDLPSTFKLDIFPTFVLQPGRHELVLIPRAQPEANSLYSVRDVFLEISVEDVGLRSRD